MEQATAVQVRERGNVKWYDPAKGFGFVVPDNGGPDLFLHWTRIKTEGYTLRQDERVEFEVYKGPKGPYVVNVEPVAD